MRKTGLILALTCFFAGCSANYDYYIIDHFYIPEEGDAFRKSFDEMTIDTYNWYKSIEGEDGVYILHSDYYSDDLLQEWKENHLYQSVPDKGFCYFVVSENYLKDRGYALSEEQSAMIHEGVRLYLLPDTLTDEEIDTMQSFLEEDALMGLDGDTLIDTAFRKKRQISFASYHFEETLETTAEEDVSNPVIYVATCENMKYFEAESLAATGADDGYIKLTDDAFRKYADHALPEKLQKKKVTFSGIQMK